MLAGSTGLEPAASGVTGRRYNQLNYDPVRNRYFQKAFSERMISQSYLPLSLESITN